VHRNDRRRSLSTTFRWQVTAARDHVRTVPVLVMAVAGEPPARGNCPAIVSGCGTLATCLRLPKFNEALPLTARRFATPAWFA